jgi:WhiB family redox-sensing transcriptional regulator
MAPEPAPKGAELVPVAAVTQWVRLRTLLDQVGPVPCQIGPAEAWWPDAKAARGPAVRRAVAGCRRCPVSQACLAYALAADERFGVWGGTLPQQRREMRWRRAQ